MKKPFYTTILSPFFIFLFFLNVSFAAKIDSTELKTNCLNIHHIWLKQSFELTKNTVGFTAPVSGRAYSYFAIGMYESSVEIVPELKSITGQLEGYNRTSWKNEEELNWMLIANKVDYTILNYMYRAMPPSYKKRIELVNDSIIKASSKRYGKKINERSIIYGEKIAQEIIEWSKFDGGDEGFANNFPPEYKPPYCPSCWVKTAPGFLPSLLPYWGQNKRLLPKTQAISKDCKPFVFSEEQNSFMYKQAMIVNENAKMTDSKHEIIAEYWDDGAGYSGTPTGHFYTIASQIAQMKKMKIDDALEMYLKLGIAVNEAFISAFELKYKYNFIRPITYIQRNINSDFNSRIASPPFPEFPSGHSFQSGAATEVMKAFFTDKTVIIDSTNYSRTDIVGTPRTYQSFTEMSEEISISRLYGGIHFRETLDVSLAYGRKIGIYVCQTIKCRK